MKYLNEENFMRSIKIILFLFILLGSQINYAMEHDDLDDLDNSKFIRIRDMQLRHIHFVTNGDSSEMECEIKDDDLDYNNCSVYFERFFLKYAPSIEKFFAENKDNPKLKLSFFAKNKEKCVSKTNDTVYDTVGVKVSALVEKKCYPIYFTAATEKNDVEFFDYSHCTDCIAMQAEIDASNKQAISIKNISPNSNMLVLFRVDILKKDRSITIKMREDIKPNSSGFVLDLKKYFIYGDQDDQIVFYCLDANSYEKDYFYNALIMRYALKIGGANEKINWSPARIEFHADF
jgi:hypothetical protein